MGTATGAGRADRLVVLRTAGHSLLETALGNLAASLSQYAASQQKS